MLSRLLEGRASKRMDGDTLQVYVSFLQNLEELLSKQIFPDACTDRRQNTLECSLMLVDALDRAPVAFVGEDFIKSLVACLDDGYAKARDLALDLLLKLQATSAGSTVDNIVHNMLKWNNVLSDCAALSPNLTTGAPYKASLLLRTSKLAEEFGCDTLAEVLITALEKLTSIVAASLKHNDVIDRNAPTYGLLLCARKVFNDLSKECLSGAPVVTTRLQKWTGNILDMMNDISSKTTHILESDSPEGHARAGEGALEVQANLLCAWRASKELSLLLSDMFVTKHSDKTWLLSADQQLKVVKFFCHLLEVTIHRGSFEQAYAGFVNVCSALWNSEDPGSQLMLKSLLDSTMDGVKSKEFVSTRRSAGKQLISSYNNSQVDLQQHLFAGIPFLVQALIASQPPTTRSMPFVTSTMERLLDIGNTSEDSSLRVQACNILRGLYRNNNLGDNIGSFVEEGLRLAFGGFRSATWSVCYPFFEITLKCCFYDFHFAGAQRCKSAL